MNINTRDLSFLNFNLEEMQWLRFNNLLVWEAWKELIASGVLPLTLSNSVGKDLVDYKIYGNSIQDGTPTPDNPVEIQSAGDKTKNLVYTDISYWQSGQWNSSAKIENNTRRYCTKTLIPFKSNISYTVSIKNNTSSKNLSCIIREYDNNKNLLSTNSQLLPRTYVSNSDVSYIGVTIFDLDGADINSQWWQDNWEKFNLQIEENSTETDYEPYGYKIPVKVSGKNSINFDELKKYSNWRVDIATEGSHPTSKSNIGYLLNLEKGETYTISYDLIDQEKFPKYLYLCREKDNNGYLVRYLTTSVIETKEFTFTAEEGYNYFLRINSSSFDTYINYLKYIQLEKGITATEYEPYQESAITNIYLDEPLRKVGDYADYIDFENQKVVRNIKSADITNLSWSKFSTYNTYYSLVFTDALYDNDVYCLSNLYKGGKSGGGTSNGTGYIWFQNNSIYPRLYISDDNYTDVDSFKNYIEELVANDTPINLLYILKIPTEENIELPNIPTFKDTNIIEVDTEIQPSNVEVKYLGLD